MCTFIHVIPPSLAADSDKPSKAATKLFFTAGPRAMRYLAESSRHLSLTSQALGSARTNASERAARVEELRREGLGDNDALRKEMAKLVAESAMSKSGAEERTMIWVHRDQKATHDFEFLQLLAGSMTSSDQWLDDGVAVMTSAVDGTTGGLLLVQSKEDAKAKRIKDELSAAIDALAEDGLAGKRVRGGGAKGRYMCKVEGKFGRREREAIQGTINNKGN